MTLSEKIFQGRKILSIYHNNKPMVLKKDIKEFINDSEFRIENELRIHWSWLKKKSFKEVSDFINNIIDKKAGSELAGSGK